MEKQIEFINEIDVIINRSSRKTVALVVHQNNKVEVRCPYNYPKSKIIKFIEEKANWISHKQMQNKNKVSLPELTNLNNKQIHPYKQYMKMRIESVITNYKGPLPIKWIYRRQKSRWGSCSSKRQISMNLHAVFLPDDLFRYLVMHEISHLLHMNHGKDFWNYLESLVPGAKECQRRLNNFRLPD